MVSNNSVHPGREWQKVSTTTWWIPHPRGEQARERGWPRGGNSGRKRKYDDSSDEGQIPKTANSDRGVKAPRNNTWA